MAAQILPSLCFAPIQAYCKFISGPILIDLHEHYIKQTYRNRFVIATANGMQTLSIPVEQYEPHTATGKIKISYSEPWQRNHWRSITSAYKRSPFFEFYENAFHPFFETQRFEYLHEFNTATTKEICRLLKLEVPRETEAYVPLEQNDLRELISPRKEIGVDVLFRPMRYAQVFEERHGFLPNLSVFDLICCVGPSAVAVLRSSVV
ncbi:MAG: WbqC family protein [Bacteroidia bacterium]